MLTERVIKSVWLFVTLFNIIIILPHIRKTVNIIILRHIRESDHIIMIA